MDALIEQWASLRSQFPLLLGFTANLLAALIILVFGLTIGRWIRRRIRHSNIGGEHLDPTLKPVFASALFYVIIAMTLYAALIKIGIPPTSLIAVFGAAGLAIGLSLKDTLSNIAAGIMILVLRPLEVGEFVNLGAASGTIKEVGLFATTLKTSDGIYQYIPNSKVWDSRIQNFGRHSIRRFTLQIGVGYDSDLRKAQDIILNTLSSARDIVIDAASPPEVHVTSFGDIAVQFSGTVWLPRDNWAARGSEIRIATFEALTKAGIDIPSVQKVTA